jgi:uncharacterized protein (DUF58 family)
MMMVLLLSTGVLAFSTGQNVFFLLFSLIASSILLSSVVNRLMLAGLRLELELPEHVCAGQPVEVTLTLRNTKEWVTSFALDLQTGQGLRFSLPALEPLGRMSFRFAVVFPRRGYPAPEVIDLSTRFPFGFSKRITRVHVLASRPLYPSISPQQGFPAIVSGLRQSLASERASGSHDFSHLRDYQPGDSLKHVAWAASARRDALLVKSFNGEATGEALLYFDRSSPEFERLVDLAASIVWELHFQKDPFVFLSDEGRWPVRDTMEAYAVLRYLALVEALADESLNPHPFPVARSAVLSFRHGALALPDTPAPSAERR